MKKFRVTKVDGTVEIIEANNMENAISLARNMFGQLPNDVNTKIVNDVIDSLYEISTAVKDAYITIRSGAKELDWEKVYAETHKVIEDLKTEIEKQEKLVGSMVKINKEENTSEEV